jgi:Protein of unknown function (DUF2690)
MYRERLKQNQASRLLLLVGLPLVTTLIVLAGVTALHLPGFSLVSLAHAMTRSSTCATTKGTQQDLCEGQNPGTQGCLQDAQTTEMQSVYVQNTLIGEVDLRHSVTCDTYWVRTIAYANVMPQIQSLSATIAFNGTVHERQERNAPRGQRMIVVTNMLFWPATQKLRVVTTFSGTYTFGGQIPSLTIPL